MQTITDQNLPPNTPTPNENAQPAPGDAPRELPNTPPKDLQVLNTLENDTRRAIALLNNCRAESYTLSVVCQALNLIEGEIGRIEYNQHAQE